MMSHLNTFCLSSPSFPTHKTMTLLESAHNILVNCMNAKAGESVLIVTDSDTDILISDSLFEAATSLGCEALHLNMNPRQQHGAELPDVVASAMKHADIIIAPTTKSLTHTRARREAQNAGSRIASMPSITVAMMTEGGILADYSMIEQRAEQMIGELAGVREVRITTQKGCDITLDVTGCEWMADTGICHTKGSATNLPAGELYVAPCNANGTIVIDGSMGGIGVLESPLVLTIKNRRVVNIDGAQASRLSSILIDDASRNVAELGIGLNPCANLIGNVLEDEKVAGTVHIAVGDNSSFGGDVVSNVHLDGIITEPTVYVDGKKFELPEHGVCGI